MSTEKAPKQPSVAVASASPASPDSPALVPEVVPDKQVTTPIPKKAKKRRQRRF